MRGDVGCCWLFTMVVHRIETPGVGAVDGWLDTRWCSYNSDSMETWRESSCWSLLFSLPFPQHPRFRFPPAALQGEAVVSVAKDRTGESAQKMVLSCRHLSVEVKSCCGDVAASGTAPAKRLGWRWLLQSWDFFSPLSLVLRKRKGKQVSVFKGVAEQPLCQQAGRCLRRAWG